MGDATGRVPAREAVVRCLIRRYRLQGLGDTPVAECISDSQVRQQRFCEPECHTGERMHDDPEGEQAWVLRATDRRNAGFIQASSRQPRMIAERGYGELTSLCTGAVDMVRACWGEEVPLLAPL